MLRDVSLLAATSLAGLAMVNLALRWFS